AIAAAIMALVADLTRDQHRTKAMAMIGMSIGLSFAVAMVVGPLIAGAAGLAGVFYSTSLLALVGIALVALLAPSPKQAQHSLNAEVTRGALLPAMRNAGLLRVNYGIARLQSGVMDCLVAVPLALQEHAGLSPEPHS